MQSAAVTRAHAGRPLRVAFVASSYNYIKDGVALTLNRLVAYLERQGAKTIVFAPVAKTPAFRHNGTLVPVPSMPLPLRPEYRFTFPMPRATADQLRAFRPDIVHIALAPDLLGLSALRLARGLGVPLVASYHTRFETYLKHYGFAAVAAGLLRRYMRYAYGTCREVYVPSQSMVDALLADGFRDNFRLWPRGVDTARFSPAKRSEAWRARHGIGGEVPAVAFISRLVREKRTDVVIDTLRLLEARGIAHRAVIVGDGPELAHMRRRLPDAVFAGFLEGEELAEAYASCDIFLFPSETETFGNVTLEAMASGLVCVCADATGSRSLVVDGSTGYLAKPGRAEDFAARIAALAADAGLRRQMSAAARERSLSYTWDEAMARIHGYYQSLVADAPP